MEQTQPHSCECVPDPSPQARMWETHQNTLLLYRHHQMQVTRGKYRKSYSISRWIKKLNDSCKMCIYGMYRVHHRSLTIKLSQFITSAPDMTRYTVQGSFLERRGNSTNLNTENSSYKILKNIFQSKMIKQTYTQKQKRLLCNHRLPKRCLSAGSIWIHLLPAVVYTGSALGIHSSWE